MEIYEVITVNDKELIPIERTLIYCGGWLGRITGSMYLVDRKIRNMLGDLSDKVDVFWYGYGNVGKGFHIDVKAQDEKEAINILEENREKIDKIYREVFGLKLGNFEIWRKH